MTLFVYDRDDHFTSAGIQSICDLQQKMCEDIRDLGCFSAPVVKRFTIKDENDIHRLLGSDFEKNPQRMSSVHHLD